jgi:pimeloyl-ACP methyl ester carboxylesterase
VLGATHVVEDMHGTVTSFAPLLGDTSPQKTSGLTRFVYRNIRGITHLVGFSLDVTLRQLAPVLKQPSSAPARQHVVAALNGVVGAYLEATQNPLAIPTSLRHEGRTLDPATLRDRRRVVVLLHGSCMSEVAFERNGQNLGRVLAETLDATTVYGRYNSGLPIYRTGSDIDALLDACDAAWGEEGPEVTLVGFSMGGLVLRSALDHAAQRGAAWPSRVKRLVTIGTPHHGAPLERVGNVITQLLGATPYAAPIGRLALVRGAGVQDLRYGAVTAHDHAVVQSGTTRDTRTPVPLPSTFPSYAIAGSLSPSLPAHVLDARSDGMVPVASALGAHKRAALTLGFPPEHQRVVAGCSHLGLLDSRSVADQLRAWFPNNAASPSPAVDP